MELRERVLQKTSEVVISQYDTFVNKFGQKKFSKNPSKYLAYNVSTLKSMLAQLFDESNKT